MNEKAKREYVARATDGLGEGSEVVGIGKMFVAAVKRAIELSWDAAYTQGYVDATVKATKPEGDDHGYTHG